MLVTKKRKKKNKQYKISAMKCELGWFWWPGGYFIPAPDPSPELIIVTSSLVSFQKVFICVLYAV